MLTDINKNLSFYLDKKIISPPADDLLSEGEIIEVACFKMKVIHTPGHSPGSISLYDENLGLLFSGDTIFKFGVGRTDLYGSNEKQLKDSINKLLNLPEIVKVYPGHGEETSIKDFRKNNWYYI